jgi:threonine dehydrogenase-like Zn-dependent dehydrogenase
MKSQGIFYVAPQRVELREFEIGEPAPDQVQIELGVTGLCAYDLALYNGFVPSGYAYPFLHGHEGVGVVRQVGARVTRVKPGDKVAVMGNSSRLLGHIANVPETMVARIPDDVAQLELWLAEPVSTVVNSIEWTNPVPGDRVAIVGAGFMGLMFAQALKYSLAAELIAMDLDDARLALARQFGATQTINVNSAQGQAQLEALQKNPVDISIESGGTQATLDLSYRILRAGGRLNIFGSHRGAIRQVDVYEWHHLGLQVVNTSPKISHDYARVFQRTVTLMQKGIFDLRPLITHALPPERAPELYAIANARTPNYIKGIVKWNES